MAAPGDNLDFTESRYFSKVAGPVPEARKKIVDHLRNWPQAGDEIAQGVRLLRLDVGGKVVAVCHRRMGNRIGLLHLFPLPEGQARLDIIRGELIKLFGPVPDRRQK